MPAAVVVDSGPLVALFDGDDQHHRHAVVWLQSFAGRLITTVAVVTEVAYLLDFNVRAQVDFIRWIGHGGALLTDLSAPDLQRAAEIMIKYQDLPADFTDASLVAICERLAIREVASIDHHFAVYRYRNRLRFRNVFPTA